MLKKATDTPIDFSRFAHDEELTAKASELAAANGGTLGRAALERAFNAAMAGNKPDADALRRLIVASRGKPAEGAKKALELQNSDLDEVKSKGALLAENLHKSLDKKIVGQHDAKTAFCTALRASPPGKAKRPTVMIMTGPSGVGKTEMGKALTEELHGPGVEPIIVSGESYKTQADLNKLTGSAPGFVGSDPKELEKYSPFSEARIKKHFSGKKPAVFILDEVDDIGRSDPGARALFWSLMNKAFDEGYFELSDGTKIDLTGAIFLITSNAGLDTVGNLKGEARRKHFSAEFEKTIPEKIMNRIGRGNIVPCDPLSEEELRQVADDRFLKPLMNNMTQESERKQGLSLTIEAEPEAATLIARLSHNDRVGARDARQLIDKLIEPLLLDKADTSKDEDRLVLRTKTMTPVQMADTVAAFRQAQGIPPGMTPEESPFYVERKRSQPVFETYTAESPFSPIAQPQIFASGVIGGRGFMLFDQRTLESQNELVLLKAGPTPAQDEFTLIKLPDALANANFRLDAVSLGNDDHRMVISGVHITEPDEVSTPTYLYDRLKKEFIELPSPKVPLVGATWSAVDGKVLVTGGRFLMRDNEGWSVKPASADDPTANTNNQTAIENCAYLLDPSVKDAEWEEIPGNLPKGTCGAATVTIGDEVWLLGGEQLLRLANGVLVSEASADIVSFNVKTKTFTTKKDGLPLATAYAKAALDLEGRIQLAGGVDIQDDGNRFVGRDTFLRLNPKQPDAKWKLLGALPSAASDLAFMPRGKDTVTGPFFDDEGTPTLARLVP